MLSFITIANLINNLYIIPELISHAGWSIIIGIIIAIVMVVLLLAIIKGFYPKSVFSTPCIVISMLLGLLLSIQLIPICACFALKSNLDDFENWINETVVHPERYLIPEEISTEESKEIIDKAVNEYPILGILVSSGEFTGFNTSDIASVIAKTLNDFLNKLILKLLLIALVEMLVCAFIIVRLRSQAMQKRMMQRGKNRIPKTIGSRRVSRPSSLSRHRR